MKKLFIIGNGGHSKVVAETAIKSGFNDIVFVEKCPKLVERNNLISEATFKKKYLEKKVNVCIALGFNYLRNKVAEQLKFEFPHIEFPTLIHNHSTVSPSAKVMQGTVIFAGARVGPSAQIGSFVIINHNSSIDHDCLLSDFSSIGPGVQTGGRVRIGLRSYIAIGATVLHDLEVGRDAIIGAGAVVNKNIKSRSVVFGVPAKFIRLRDPEENYLKRD